MKIIHIDLNSFSGNNSNNEDNLKLIADAIQQGMTVVFPTDTCYGIAVDPCNQKAMDRLFLLKNRPHNKNVSCIFKDLEQVYAWAKLDERQNHILQKNLPGTFTFILTAKNECPIRQLTVGVRIPDFSFATQLSQIAQIPYTATSANIGGMPSCYKVEDFLEQIKSINGIYPDLIVDAGELRQNPPSTVVDLTKQKPVIVRQGNVILKD